MVIKNKDVPEFLIDQENNNKDVEYLKETAEHLFKSNTYKDVSVRTDLNEEEIMAISILRGINKNLNFKSIDVWVIDLMRLRYSKQRRSRKEFIETMSYLMQRLNDMFGGMKDNINNKMFNKGF